MSNNIDNRIVKMQFDNKQFEKGVEQTTKSLDELKEGLDLSNSAKSLTNLNNAGKKFSLAGMASGVDALSNRFSTMGVVGFTVIQNLTNSALNAGKKIISALTIDPVKSGLEEYETKMNAITTILTNTKSKGTTLDNVNDALADLNEYADLTIYNFAEMTKNIGTFTAAGIGLEDSTTAIKGIANLAAGSGSSAQQASTAMYQLSQALAAGSLKLMDWNSVVNAGMGGELFQTALKDTAKSMGIVVDESVPFRESLQEGWITSEVLIETLKGFTDTSTEMGQSLTDAATKVKTMTQLFDVMQESVQSGWSVSWEQIIGDRDQAIGTLTAISDAFNNLIGPSANARNEALTFWNQMGGREDVIQGITNVFTSLGNILRPIGEAFREIFPRKTGEDLVRWSARFRELTEGLIFTEEAGEKVKTIFKGFFSIFDLAGQGVGALVEGFKALISLLPNIDLAGAAESAGEFLTNLADTVRETDIFNKAINNTKNALVAFGIKVSEAVKPVFETLAGGIEALKPKFTEFGNFVKDKADVASESLRTMAENFKTFATVKTDGVKSALSQLAEDAVPTVSIMGTLTVVFDGFSNVLDAIKTKLSGVGDLFGSLGTSIKEGFLAKTEGFDSDTVVKALGAGALGTIAVFVGKLIFWIKDLKSISGSLIDGVVEILGGVQGALEAYQTQLKAGALLKIAVSIGILAASLIALSTIDPEKLGAGMVGMTSLLLGLFGSAGVLKLIASGDGLTSANTVIFSMLALSSAMVILSKAMKNMAGLKAEEVKAATDSLSQMMLVLAASSRLVGGGANQNMIGASIGIIAMAVALKKLAKTVDSVGQMDTDQLKQGMLGVSGMMAILIAFMNATKNVQNFGVSAGLGMIALAKGVKILGDAVERFGQMDYTTLGIGLSAVAVLLYTIAQTMKMMPDDMIVVGTGILVLSASLLIMQKAVEKFGSMDPAQLGIGLSALAIGLYAIAETAKRMPGNMIAIGAGIGVMAVGMLIMAEAIEKFGSMDWQVLAIGLGAFVAVLLLMWGAGALIGPFVPVLLGLGAAIALMGASVALAGAGLLAFATALGLIAALGVAGAASLTIAFTAIAALIPLAMQKFGEGLVAFAQAIKDGIPALIEAGEAIFLAFIQSIADTTPQVVETALDLLITLMTTFRDKFPEILELGTDLLLTLLQGISDSTQEIVETGIDIVLAFMDGVAEKLPDIIDSGYNMMISFIDGLADAIDKNTEPLTEAVIKLMEAIKNAAITIITEWYPYLKEKAYEAWLAIVDAVTEAWPKLTEAVTDMVENAIETITGFTDSFKEAGKNVIGGFISGIADSVVSVAKGAGDMAKAALDGAKDMLDINSPSKAFRKIGIFTGEGFISGMKVMGRKVLDAGKDLGAGAIDAVSGALNKVKDLSNGGLDVDPTIRPIVDLSGVESARDAINSMLSDTDSIITTRTATAKVQSINRNQSADSNGQKGSTSTSSVAYNFEQTINSPKPLSRLEIYRQTKNQFSTLKGAVNA